MRVTTSDGVREAGVVLNCAGLHADRAADLVLACFFALFSDSPAGSQVYLAANDEDQADDDLDIAKKLLRINPALEDMTTQKSTTSATHTTPQTTAPATTAAAAPPPPPSTTAGQPLPPPPTDTTTAP